MPSHARSSPNWKPLWWTLAAAAPLLLPGLGHAATSCAEVRAQYPDAGDGTYSLTLGGQRVALYCHDMAGTPREYLTLPKTGSTTNYAHYAESLNTSANGLKSWYTKARFDPATLALDLGDTTFSTSEGWVLYGNTYIYSQGLGNAADCVAPNSQTGRANIDLTGTPFDIVPNQFQLNGYLPAGSATPSGSQIVNLTAGGYCGAIGTADGRLRLDLRSVSEPTPELVHRYSFTTSGVDSVSGANATLEGGATIADGEVVLNGAGAYVNLPIGGTIAILQDATFEAWVRWNSTEAQVMARIFDFNDNVRSSMFLTSSNGSTPLFALTTPQGGEELVPANHNPFPVGVLTHVAVTLDHTTGLIRLYVNGLEVARSHTDLTPARLGTTANNWLGRSLSTVHPFFKGSISEFRVYRTALSPSRIAANFSAGDAPRELRTSFSTRPANPTNVDTASFIFSANWTDLHSLCSLNGAAFQPCTSPFEIQSLSEDLHTFRVQARDVMGNVEASPVTYSWRVDKTPPETSFASAPEPETRLRSPTFSFVSSEPRSTFECSLDAAPFSECPAGVVFPPLDDGKHQLAVRARDEASNVDPEAAHHAWTVDTVAPMEPSLQEPAPGQKFLTDRPLFSGTAEPGTTVTLLVDGIDAGSVHADARGVWRRQPEVPLPWGTHRVSVSATDRAGNVSPLPPEVPFLTSRRGAYRLGCSAAPSSWQGSWPWVLLVLGLLRPRSRS
ncbi:hypothetical protein D187_009365 [Cystobacter fuscus DSM 2262]|uniref:LamG-like jellyroll fold domain-containing protein n=1 Tax=Cystobacter fuscus (strain ATCC 25194 / DSM 2262 / NBRC 100088 / M29) TaxID=1242864 RepID=S9NTB4_CYSF2|nr:LamG-like jellyroll fold domain-containing protein [Cystobacter fuscus]EPX55370.1 hypothetical protein D187_009365 [Cystobacter fuscus DSM 2262]